MCVRADNEQEQRKFESVNQKKQVEMHPLPQKEQKNSFDLANVGLYCL